MFSRIALFALVLPALSVAADGAPSSGGVTLEILERRSLSDGLPNRVPGPIAGLLDVPPNIPVHQFKVSKDQSSDGMSHMLKVMVELSTTTPPVPVRPLGLVLFANRVQDGALKGYWYRASLDGTLERAVLIEGKTNQEGVALKGSGGATEQDIKAPAVKAAFQHELDLWLKKSALKKEWRAAEFSDGGLRKTGQRR